uniref:RAB3GAP2_N domain-containing protein n=1 Tax=Gongylonema pulchrum TaxID=637853 RepID=A0A183D4J9_9BILA
LVITRDICGRLFLAVVDRDIGLRVYQLLAYGPPPIRPDCCKVQQLLNKAFSLFAASSPPFRRAYCATQC